MNMLFEVIAFLLLFVLIALAMGDITPEGLGRYFGQIANGFQTEIVTK